MICRDARNDLSAYLDGELSDTAARAMERHLASCPECHAALQSLGALDVRLSRLPDPPPPPGWRPMAPPALLRSPRRAPWWAVAAAAALLAAALFHGVPAPTPHRDAPIVIAPRHPQSVPPTPRTEDPPQVAQDDTAQDKGHRRHVRTATAQRAVWTLPRIEQALGDPEQRLEAMRILAAAGTEDTWSRWLPAWNGRPEELDACLADLPPPAAHGLLARLTQHEQGEVRRQALRALTTLDPQGALPYLGRALARDADRDAALQMVSAYPAEEAVPLLLDAGVPAAALHAWGREAAEILARRTVFGDPSARRDSLRLLSDLETDERVPALVRALDDPCLRDEALRGLARAADPRATRRLAEMLHSGVGRRSDVLAALASTGDPAALPPILRATRDRVHAADALQAALRFDDPKVDALLRRAVNNPSLVAEAAPALAERVGSDALPHLVRGLTNPALRRSCRGALTEIAGEDLGNRPDAWIRWWKHSRKQGGTPCAVQPSSC